MKSLICIAAIVAATVACSLSYADNCGYGGNVGGGVVVNSFGFAPAYQQPVFVNRTFVQQQQVYPLYGGVQPVQVSAFNFVPANHAFVGRSSFNSFNAFNNRNRAQVNVRVVQPRAFQSNRIRVSVR